MGIAGQGSVEQKLVKGQFALKDVAFGQPNLCLQLTRGADLDMQNARLEPGGIGFDLVQTGRAKGVAVGMSRSAPRVSWRPRLA